MPAERKPLTAEANGRLWGSSAEDWAGIQEATCRAVYLEVLDRLEPEGKRYLDVGCGSGMAANLAWGRGAEVAGVDAATHLIEIARRQTPAGRFEVCDIETLPFVDSRFDVITGFNAFQYAGDPGCALSEAKRVAKVGAAVVIMTWGEPEGMEAASLVAALKPLLPAPPPGAPGPFALSDESVLRAFAEGAGLEPIEVVDVSSPWEYASLDTALRGLASSGVATRAKEHSSPEAVDRANSNALEPFRRPDGTYRIDATFRCLFTRA